VNHGSTLRCKENGQPYLRSGDRAANRSKPGFHLGMHARGGLFDIHERDLSCRVFDLEHGNVRSASGVGLEAALQNRVGPKVRLALFIRHRRLLRYARSAQLVCAWNLLFGFPGDQPEEYRGVLALLPLLHHLNPPVILNRMGIDRFSPYWENPAAYGLSNIRPFPAYAETFPVSADVERLAYHFLADFDSGSISDVELIGLLHEEVDSWRKAWITGNGAQPQLWVNRLGGDLFLLRDTRGLPGTQESRVIPLDHAAAALAGRHVSAEARKWALDHKVAVVLEGEYLPLATATPELLFEFEGG